MTKFTQYKKLFFVLVAGIMLLGTVSFGAGLKEWKEPTGRFPSGNTFAPINTGNTNMPQERGGLIDFNTHTSGTSSIGIKLRFGYNDFLGNTSTKSFLSFLGSPTFTSDKPFYMNAPGIVVPIVSTQQLSAPAGALAFDPSDNLLKYRGNNDQWIGFGTSINNLWKKDAQGIKSEDKNVTVGSFTSGQIFSAKKDVNIGQSSVVNKFVYFPVYDITPKRIPSYLFTTTSRGSPEERLYNFSFEGVEVGYSPDNDRDNRLLCDLDPTKLDCLGTYSSSSFALSKEVLYDVAYVDPSNRDFFPLDGFVKMKYQKYADEYVYDDIGDVPIFPNQDYQRFFPRAYCDQHVLGVNIIRYNMRGGDVGTEGIECEMFDREKKFPSPPPESGWPDVIYDRYFSTTRDVQYDLDGNRMSTQTRARKFERRYIGSHNNAVPGGRLIFSPKATKTSDLFTIHGSLNEEKIVELGNYSYCALSYKLIRNSPRAWCGVYYDQTNKKWFLKYGKASNTKVGCKANCF